VLPSDKFSVRIECIDTQFDLKERMDIERKLGAHIQSVTKAGVELDNPTVNILVIVLPDRILVCKSVESKLRQLLRTREPGKKPFFHPSMMNSTLARVMCNLAGVRPDSTVLDPFCGGGGILCEAAFMNSTAIGMDLNWRLLEGAKRNLEEITTKYSIVQADALHPPIQAVDHIVTDPPYGRSSSTRGVESKRLFASLLSMAPQMLCSHGENICVCGSTEMGLPEMIRTTGLNIGIAIKDRVHSGLVREIVTIRL
jgi:tRNA (guanine10-N2)-dimethyltransferase